MEYFDLLTDAACCVASLAPIDVRPRCDLSHDNGRSVTPSGGLPSPLVKPNGSFWVEMFALPNAPNERR